MDVPNLDATPAVPKTGDEPLHESGRLLGQQVRDFWAWAYSDLLGNAMRGVLAEYLVGTALGCVHGRTRLEWDAWDLRTADGIRVEIKSAAYLQSWHQSAYSRISFDIRPTTAWYAETNTYSPDRRRQADVYVFCLFAHRDKATADPLDVDQWEFYVTSAHRLDETVGEQKRMSLQPCCRGCARPGRVSVICERRSRRSRPDRGIPRNRTRSEARRRRTVTERQRVALEHTGWDTPRPGAMGFDYCPYTVHWRNETTGASGAAEPVTDLLPVQTATVTITATVTLDGACITLQSGTATWHAA